MSGDWGDGLTKAQRASEQRALFFAIIWIVVFFGVLLLCGCSAKTQTAPVIGPPQIVEVIKPVPIPCPVPPDLPQPALLLPLLDTETAPVNSILQVLRADYATLWLAYQQAVDLLRVYVQQAEVATVEQ